MAMAVMPAAAQGAPATISGQIIDVKSALPIAGATVIASRGHNRAGSTHTDSSGHYTLPGVAPGVYTLTVSASGFQSAITQDIVVTAGSVVTTNTTLVAVSSSTDNLQTIGRVRTSVAASLASATTITQSLDINGLISTGQLRVADQLRTLPAVNESTSSSPGDDVTVNLRAFGSTETATLLDGRPIGPLGVLNPEGGFNYAGTPISGLSTVDVTYGSGAQGVYGSDTIGGAINFVTLSPTAQPHFSFVQQYGGFNHTATGISATGTADRLGYVFATGVSGEEGSFNGQPVFQGARPNNPAATSVSPNANCINNSLNLPDVSPCNDAVNTYAVGQNTRNSSILGKIRYDLSPVTSLTGTVFSGGHLADSTGNGDNDFLPYNTRLAKVVTTTPTCTVSPGVPGFEVITQNNGSGLASGLTTGCLTAQQFAAATSGPDGGGSGRSRSSSDRDYDLHFATQYGINNISADAYIDNYWYSKNSAQAGGIDAFGNFLGTPDFTDFYNTKGYLISDDVVTGNNDLGFGYSLINQLQSGNQLVATGNAGNGAATFAFAPDFPSAYFSEGSGFIRDSYTANRYLSLFANGWLKRSSVTQKTTFDPRVSALVRPTGRDVFRLSFGRSDGPPSPNLKSTGQVFAADPGASLTTVSCLPGGNTIASGGNPNLTSEAANDFEAGYGHRFKDDSNVQLSAYVTSVSNQLISGSEPLLQYGLNNVTFDSTILSHYLLALQQQCGVVPGSTFADIYKYLGIGNTFNIGHELARGLEFSGRERINRRLYIDYGYYIESIQQSGISDAILANNATLINGGQVASIPLHQGTISVDFAPGPWEFRVDNYYTEQNNPLNRPSYWYSNAFISYALKHGRTILTLGGTNVFNQAAQYYGYIGQGTFTRYNPVFATVNGVNAANGLQEYVNGISSNEEFGITPAQITLTLSERI